MNTMPSAPTAQAVERYLSPCRPYLAKRRSDGRVSTVVRVKDSVLYISEDTTSQSGEEYFWNSYQIIREFAKGEDTVTIANW